MGFGSASTSNSVGGLNSARGDTASINLRALGTGNTLVLLNGRRMVNHPGTQAENLVPVVTVNANAIPTMGVKRIEVLLDGASALYGTDAVAGVVNTVLKSDIEGFTLDLTYGGEEGTSSDEFTASMEFGIRSPDEATRLSVMASYFTRDPIFASDRDFTANADQRGRLPGVWAADAVAANFNNTSITSAWGIFDRYSAGHDHCRRDPGRQRRRPVPHPAELAGRVRRGAVADHVHRDDVHAAAGHALQREPGHDGHQRR